MEALTMKLFKLPIMLAAAVMMLGPSGYIGAAAEGTDTAAAVYIEGEYRKEYSANEMDSLWSKAVSTSGSTIMLLDDWKIGGCKTVGSGADLNIDLNGHIIDRELAEYKSEGNLFTVENGGKLTISDSSPAAVHKTNAVRGGILTGGKSSNTGGCIEMKSGSSVTLKGCAVMSCATQQDGGAIRMNGVCDLRVDGTEFCANYAMDSSDKCHAGAIYIDDGTAIINNAVFDSNYTENNGGAIYIDDGEFRISGSLFRGNTAMKEGGAIYLAGSYNPLSVKDCTFLMNSSEKDGGAINAYSCKRLAIDGSVFSRNNSGANGGAIYIETKYVSLNNCSVINNTSAEHGGGVYVDSKYDINVQGKVVIKDNTSSGRRDNLCLQNGAASNAYISGSGLYEGSVIYIGSTKSDGKVMIAKDFSEFQRAQYIRADSGSTFIDAEKSRQVTEKFVSSVVGTGSIIAIMSGLMLMIFAVFWVCIFQAKAKKKQGGIKQ